MNFSLISVSKQSSDGKIVEGTWIQGAVACTLEDATKRAIAYEGECSSDQIDVAVVTELPSPVPHGTWTDLKRLDKSRRRSCL